MQDDRNKIGIYYEHPDWFKPLFGVLDRRQIAYEKIDAACHSYDPTVQPEYGLLFNRMSASAYLRGHGNAMFYSRGFLAHLEQAGVRVINGRQAFDYETSKALQLELFARLGLGHPKTRV